jgi:hypothetical protein
LQPLSQGIHYDFDHQGDILKSQSLRLELPSWHNFSICGAAPDDEQSGQEGAGTGSAGESQTDQKPKDDEEIRDPKGKIKSLTEERDRHFRKAQEQETELNELRKIKDEAERAKLTENERLAADTKAKDERIEGLEATNRRLALNNAFLINNSVQWHDAAAALKLVDLSAVEVNADGEVTNPDVLKAAIEKLSKDNAWMVAEPEPKKKTPAPKSGDAPSGGQPNQNQPDFEALAAKIPALRRHRPYSG